MFHQGSFLSSLTSFLPALNAGPSNGSEIVSLATHPWPTDITHVWSLSRDRTLRLWKAKAGCVSAKTLSSTGAGRASTPAPNASSSGGKHQVLLEPHHRTLLRVFSAIPEEETTYVLAFIPTPSSSDAGGLFKLFSTSSDQLYEMTTIECSRTSAHCHLQEFLVVENILFTLWDAQGCSRVDRAVINLNDREVFDPSKWQTSAYAPEAELTPAYLEELLLSPGSLTDKFFQAIMRPGTFSALTLRTAIDQYSDACLSLPGPPPSQLTTSYATLGENIAAVVGCTVNLMRDPHTGALQHLNYWNALKRDWEGFIARCREVERSARWPLALGVDGSGVVMVVERERVGVVVSEDLPLALHRFLTTSGPALSPQYALLDVLWTLRLKLGRQSMLNLETRLVDILHQEIAFSLPDILQDQAQRADFLGQLEDGLESWTLGRLESVGDVDAATRTILDVIGGFDMDVKREEDEVELLLPPAQSDFSKALTATYIATSVQARYDLCMCLVILLFFLAQELPHWDPTLLAEVFAVFRGIAMLRFVARQPGGDPSAAQSSNDLSADDVLDRLRDLQVSKSGPRYAPTCSMLHCLLAQYGDTHGLPGAAHRFLDGSGLLQSSSPAYVTKHEILICERLRLLGYYNAARELLAWLPRTAAVTYVLGCLWLNIGRADDSSYLLEKLAASFGEPGARLPSKKLIVF